MTPITELLSATTQNEIHRIERKYRDILPREQHYNLMRFVNDTSKRIARVEREKSKSFRNQLN
jgi:hypothetical protein